MSSSINRLKIVETYMKAYKPEQGIGELLHKIALEHSIKCGFKPKTSIKAVRDSHIAHYKAGFRFKNNEFNKIAEKAIKEYQNTGFKRKNIFTDFLEMKLPKSTLVKWTNELKTNPILTDF